MAAGGLSADRPDGGRWRDWWRGSDVRSREADGPSELSAGPSSRRWPEGTSPRELPAAAAAERGRTVGAEADELRRVLRRSSARELLMAETGRGIALDDTGETGLVLWELLLGVFGGFLRGWAVSSRGSPGAS